MFGVVLERTKGPALKKIRLLLDKVLKLSIRKIKIAASWK
jgi:hypothetical protein